MVTFASSRIQQDEGCAKQILIANGYCFRYLMDELQERKDLLQIAVESNPMILRELSKEIQGTEEVMQIAKQFYGMF